MEYTINLSELKKINQDTVGWIKVDNTDINYPIVQTTNNDYYLTHSFDKSNNINGWVFLNYINDSNFENKNTVIFAHNSLFSSLRNIYNSKKKQDITITIYLESQIITYKVFSIYLTTNYNVSILKTNFTQEEINNIIEQSKFNYNINVMKEDDILTLSTCYKDSSKRVIVHAKKYS